MGMADGPRRPLLEPHPRPNEDISRAPARTSHTSHHGVDCRSMGTALRPGQVGASTRLGLLQTGATADSENGTTQENGAKVTPPIFTPVPAGTRGPSRGLWQSTGGLGPNGNGELGDGGDFGNENPCGPDEPLARHSRDRDRGHPFLPPVPCPQCFFSTGIRPVRIVGGVAVIH
jgi:hypothetical protein